MKLNNGLEIPQIGVGTWTLRGEVARQNVRLALEAGFRHIDTAQGYENEAEVGQGIVDSGVQRNLITIPRAKPSHFAENLSVMTFALSDIDMQAISALNQNLRSNLLNDPETFPW